MHFDKNVDVLWDNDLFKSVVEMTMEHYVSDAKDIAILINVNAMDYEYVNNYKQNHPEQKIILYNLEHKYPLISPGRVECCSIEWCKIFERFMTLIDEVWDYNIEDYMYFESIGYGHIFKFKPLRYTSWFKQFIRETPKIYDVEFEGAFDTETRLECIRNLTTPSTYGKMIRFKLANVQDQYIKFLEKQSAIFCLDIPHYNYPETYAGRIRIFECLCLNLPVIIYDKNMVGSRKYFDGMAVCVSELASKFILNVVESGAPQNVAQIFKEMTYTNEAYDKYRRDILEDFRRISGENIPDSVL